MSSISFQPSSIPASDYKLFLKTLYPSETNQIDLLELEKLEDLAACKVNPHHLSIKVIDWAKSRAYQEIFDLTSEAYKERKQYILENSTDLLKITKGAVVIAKNSTVANPFILKMAQDLSHKWFQKHKLPQILEKQLGLKSGSLIATSLLENNEYFNEVISDLENWVTQQAAHYMSRTFREVTKDALAHLEAKLIVSSSQIAPLINPQTTIPVTRKPINWEEEKEAITIEIH
jgi:hypothetical protein